MTSGAVAVIRLTALRNNLQRVREAAPGCRVMAVIKAQAYGHGAASVAGALADANAFAVARLGEALELRAAGIDKPVVLLGGVADLADLETARQHEFQTVVHSAYQIELLEAAPVGVPVGVWLKVDTGMSRLGVGPDALPDSLERLQACAACQPDFGLMTHLACADEPGNEHTSEQLETFGRAIGAWPGDVSIASSAGIVAWPASVSRSTAIDYAGENWVRPGLMLYGVSPVAGRTPAELGLEPVMSFETGLLAIKPVRQGDTVGYGAEWRAERDALIGVAAAGYADGYPWHLKSGTPVSVGGRIAPLVGRVSMDLITIDLTDLPGVGLDDRVVLWGDEPTVGDISQRAGTIAYELLAGIGQRVSRRVSEPDV